MNRVSGTHGKGDWMRASRLLSIVLLLQNRGRLTGPELAAELEVSVRTIYRDIDSLSLSGIPVVADRGPDGGFRLLDGYRTRLTGLTPDEAGTLFLAGAPDIAADLGLSEAMATTQLKLLASLPEALRDRAERVRTRFHLDAPGWYHDEDDLAFLPLVAEAVWQQRELSWRYHRWAGKVDRTVAPLGLVLKGGVWYVVAAVEGTPRTYRVSRIISADLLATRFERPADFDLVAYWRTWSEAFNARMYPGEATIRLSPSGQRLLSFYLDSYRTRAVRASQDPPDGDGWVTARLPTEGLRQAAMELLRFGMEVQVLAPPELRRQLAELAQDVYLRYAADGTPSTSRDG